jgi:hypothetical protein
MSGSPSQSPPPDYRRGSTVPPPLSQHMGLGGLASSPAATKITAALRVLRVGDVLMVDVGGQIHRDKQAFISGRAEPLVSFKRTESGTFIVHAGVPPLNQTCCLAARDLAAKGEISNTNLHYPTVLTSGDSAFLDGYEFSIPSAMANPAGSHRAQLEALLAKAEVGARVSLGRNAVEELPSTVSRIHCTVEVLEKTPLGHRTFKLTVRVFPGIPSKAPIYLERAVGDRDQIIGQREVKSGQQIHLGKALGSIQLPHPPGSPEDVSQEASFMFAEGEVARAKALINSVPAVGDPFTSADFREGRMPRNAQLLRDYTCACLKLISTGHYAEAIDILRKPEVLQLCGYTRENGQNYPLLQLTDAAVHEHLKMMTQQPWIEGTDKRANLSVGTLQGGLAPQNAAEQTLLNSWQREVALLYAEGYIRALQGLLDNKMVSKRADLLLTPNLHADVAIFLDEHGVNSSSALLTRGTDKERKDALRVVAGFQSAGTDELFQKVLWRTPLGGQLFIGRSQWNHLHGIPIFNIPAPNDEAPEETRPGHGAHSRLQSIEAVLTRVRDGSIMIERIDDWCTIFAPNEAGYYCKVTSACTLPPGTPIYIGRAFRLVL